MSSPSSDVSALLDAMNQGDPSAQSRLWRLVYDELHTAAQRQMACEPPGKTLQTTVLVNEAFIRLLGGENVQWANRRHFFGAAAQAMRRIRIDDARRRDRLKRGGGHRAEPLRESQVAFEGDPLEVLVIDEAIERLKQVDARKAEVVVLRYFAGLSIDETAQALSISPGTVDNEWRFARAWLHRELRKGDTTTD